MTRKITSSTGRILTEIEISHRISTTLAANNVGLSVSTFRRRAKRLHIQPVIVREINGHGKYRYDHVHYLWSLDDCAELKRNNAQNIQKKLIKDYGFPINRTVGP